MLRIKFWKKKTYKTKLYLIKEFALYKKIIGNHRMFFVLKLIESSCNNAQFVNVSSKLPWKLLN